MREILFRGKTLTNKGWVYGLLTDMGIDEKESVAFISGIMVHKSTVGQFTGLTDKNDTKIFEGDIVLFPWGEKREVFSVEFVEGEFEAIPKRKSTDIWCIRIGSYAPEFEVIGNIHDNPELLKGGAE